MFKHILVPLDGSGPAEAALPAASFLSSKFKAIVTLFHAVERNAPLEVHGHPHLKNAEEATAYLQETALRAFPGKVQVNFHVHSAEVEDVAESIVQHADELDHDVIIMCSHGRGRALHLLLGSIAQKVISKGSLPVLMTHPDKAGVVPEFFCKKLLAPLDGDPDHEQALPVSAELAGVCGAALHLAVVIPGFGDLSGERAAAGRFLPGTMSRLLELSVKNAEEYLQPLLEALNGRGVEARSHVLRGDPASAIDASARRLHADLIVLATHGKSGMEAFWEGSVTHKVCSLSRVPLLLIPVGRPRG